MWYNRQKDIREIYTICLNKGGAKIRFVFSLLTRFAAWSAGMGILTTSSSIATHLTEREIKSMTDLYPVLNSFVKYSNKKSDKELLTAIAIGKIQELL